MRYTIKLNRSRRTYTICKYNSNGKLLAKYRSFPQTKEEFSEIWTENDIINFLRNTDEYYEVRKNYLKNYAK